jgi:hypothetical protein
MKLLLAALMVFSFNLAHAQNSCEVKAAKKN